MKNLKEEKPNAEIVQAVDVELNEEQLDVVSGGCWENGTGGGTFPTFPYESKKLPHEFLPPAPGTDESM